MDFETSLVLTLRVERVTYKFDPMDFETNKFIDKEKMFLV